MRTASELEFSCIRYLLANMSIPQLIYSVAKYLLYRRKRPTVNDNSYVELLKVTAKLEVARKETIEKYISNIYALLDDEGGTENEK